MDLLERHLQEHDATGQPDARVPPPPPQDASFPPSAAAGMPAPPAGYQPFPTKAHAATNAAPSPNTMAALINILQVQAQAQGLDPQAQQRQLAALLGNMPITGGLPSQAQLMGYPNVQPSQLYAAAAAAAAPTGYPYPGIDTPDHSSSSGRATAKHPQSGTESTGHTPPTGRPSEASSSPDTRAPPAEAGLRSRATIEARGAVEAGEGMTHVKRKAGDEEMEGHAAHRSRRGEGEGSEGHGESFCVTTRGVVVLIPV